MFAAACNSADQSRPAGASLKYPTTKRDSVSEVYHGTRVADPYRWFEQLDAPEVRAWATAQDEFTSKTVADDSMRGWFLERMLLHAKTWDQLPDDAASDIVGGNEFQLVSQPQSTVKQLRIRHAGGKDTTRLFIDPLVFGPRKNIQRYRVSPDGKHVAYAISDSGGEWVETRIRRVSDGQDLPEVLSGMLGGSFLWSRDSRGMFYVHQRRGTNAERVMLIEPSVRYHTISTAQSADRVLFATPVGSVESVLQIAYASRGRYLVITEGSGAVWESFSWVLERLHLIDLGEAPAPALGNPVIPLMKDKIAGYLVIGSEGPNFYVLTDRDAPRKRLVAINVHDTVPSQWREVIPQDARLVLHTMQRINNRFVGTYLNELQPEIRVFNDDGRLVQTFALPPLTTVQELSGGEKAMELSVGTSSFIQPPTFTTLDIPTGASKIAERLTTTFDTAAYQTTMEWFVSKDGTRIPMFITHRKGIKLDGSHAALMHGYGASGTVTVPQFSEDVLAWLEAGGIFAMPSLRGGGEFGREWYEAAILDRKQKTFDDFIAAAEFLIQQGYTKPDKLAIRGASNGGQLVAAVITQRPELFGVALPDVPITDNLRYDRGRHRGQFGHVSDSTQFEYLYRYSPLHRVKPGTCYPATLVSTVLNDDRAPAWNSFKFVAALQAAQSCNKPILIRVGDVGGHLGDAGENAWLEKAAEGMAFAARQFGMRAPSLPSR